MSIWNKLVGNGGNAGVLNNTSSVVNISNGTQATTLATTGYLTGTSNHINIPYSYGGVTSNLINEKYSEHVCKNIIRKFLPILIHIQSNQNIDLICDVYLKIIDLLPDDTDFQKAIDRNKIIFELLNNGEATWLMYSRHEDEYISKLSELFIYHIKE